MLPLLLLLPAAIGTSALTIPKRADAPTSTSTGFRLLVKVIKPFPDLSPPIDNQYISTAHTGAGLSTAVVSEGTSTARIWYQNGTAPAPNPELDSGILTDGGTPPAPYGIGLQGPDEFDGAVYPDEHRVDVDVGPGTPTMGVELNDEKLPVLRVHDVGGVGGKWMVCRRKIWYYYQDREFSVLRYVYGGEEAAMDECAPVELVPVCAELPELPEGSYSSHEFAVEVPCVVDAAALA